MFNKIKDTYIAAKVTQRAVIKDVIIIFIYRCAVVAALIILYLKCLRDSVKNVIKCVTAQVRKVNVPTVIAMVEKKTQPMKAAVSSLTTQENANHVNKGEGL